MLIEDNKDKKRHKTSIFVKVFFLRYILCLDVLFFLCYNKFAKKNERRIRI